MKRSAVITLEVEYDPKAIKLAELRTLLVHKSVLGQWQIVQSTAMTIDKTKKKAADK
tara:strand:- start:657 stop:827 length:171 start_codon:yes stop_codon:yes gene_type:complete